MLNGKENDEFPWGSSFPPKTEDQAGNYGDKAWQEKFQTPVCMEGYVDGFPSTAPVMSFRPNKFGLYDMGGNAWEWINDWWNAAKMERVLRGASFASYNRNGILSSNRYPLPPTSRSGNGYGFRIVMVPVP